MIWRMIWRAIASLTDSPFQRELHRINETAAQQKAQAARLSQRELERQAHALAPFCFCESCRTERWADFKRRYEAAGARKTDEETTMKHDPDRPRPRDAAPPQALDPQTVEVNVMCEMGALGYPVRALLTIPGGYRLRGLPTDAPNGPVDLFGVKLDALPKPPLSEKLVKTFAREIDAHFAELTKNKPFSTLTTKAFRDEADWLGIEIKASEYGPVGDAVRLTPDEKADTPPTEPYRRVADRYVHPVQTVTGPGTATVEPFYTHDPSKWSDTPDASPPQERRIHVAGVGPVLLTDGCELVATMVDGEVCVVVRAARQ